MASNLYFYGKTLVAKLYDDENRSQVFVKDVKTGDTFNVYRSDLKKYEKTKPTQPTPQRKPLHQFSNANACPNCRTPDHVPGIECPGCGIKESFKAWLLNHQD